MGKIEKNTFLPGQATRAELKRLSYSSPLALSFIVWDMAQEGFKHDAVKLSKESAGAEKEAYKRLLHGFPSVIQIKVINSHLKTPMPPIELRLEDVSQVGMAWSGKYEAPVLYNPNHRGVLSLQIGNPLPKNFVINQFTLLPITAMSATKQDVADAIEGVGGAEMTEAEAGALADSVFGGEATIMV